MPDATAALKDAANNAARALTDLTSTRLPALSQPEYERINHPQHYGGQDDPYEAIKVINAWGLGFNLGNVVKYISRAGKKPGTSYAEDLRKALFYLEDEIRRAER